MADLFLDTELQERDYICMADKLRATGISNSELQGMLENEVGPALGHNLFIDIAGEWAGWADDYVIARVLETLRDGPTWLLPKNTVREYCRQEWARLEPLLRSSAS